MQKIFLTGGQGMVGTCITHHLPAPQYEIHTPTRAELNLRRKSDVFSYIRSLSPHMVIHAAGRVGGINANIHDPWGFLLENLEIGTNVISAAAEAGIPRLINIASSCIYPKDIDGLLTEDLVLGGRLEPTNEGYALAKISALRLCEFANKHNPNLDYKTLIPCNLYGPHDKFQLELAHLVPAIIRKVHHALSHDLPTVEIWGDGSARREFMYVNDLAELIALSVNNFDSLPNIMNAGVGKDHSILDYYQAVAAAIGWNGQFTFNLDKPTGMRRKLLDVSRQTAWGWAPSTTLAQGIAQTYNYFLQTEVQ